MSEVNNKTESRVEKKRLRGRNSHEVINQIVESFNASEGWALKRVNMIGMNVEVYLERSVDQSDSANTKEVSNAKQSKEETVKASEPQEGSKEVVVDVEDVETTAKPAAKRGRATKK